MQAKENKSLRLPCPAKLNLFLHILGKRPDGYHELQTIFQLLDYGDELELTHTDNGGIELTTNLAGVPVGDNLVFRAAQLLKAVSGSTCGAKLHLHKRLPAGGGIGGGSSDAATALVGLNALWETGLPLPQLANLGAQLGADIPVFILGESAWAEGVGEVISPLELPQKWFVVIAPKCHVSTAEIFSHKDLTRDSKRIKVRASLEEGGKNDCQSLVERLFPQVKDAVDWLGQFGHAQMTGTGACVFACFDSEEIAQEIFAKRPERLDGFVAKGVNQSPLHQRLQI